MPPDTPALVYAQVADKIRARIADGTYGIGMPLPAENSLAEEFGVSRNSVRDALRHLGNEGLVHPVHRRGTFVSPPRPKRRIEMSRYRDELAAALRSPDTVPDPAGLPRAEVSDVEADDALAALFGVPAGTLLVRRDWVIRVGGVPAQMTTSYLLAEMVTDRKRLHAGGGVITYLASISVYPTRVVELVTSRPPTGHEARVLQVGSGWVLATTRQILAGDRVVEVGREIVVPAQGTELVSEIDLR